ncbi:hypothetical protein ACWNT8_03350 [Pigmentibacter ruber]|uniref:hypothetical protein n=1 Tax=Pigmentibacter ruber TaxID=2683196 RepID=UPI00131BB867|nr:hypothetical protein [Pigmentibacter ruber]
MNAELKTIALLIGQFTSTVIFIIVIWVFADTEFGKNLFAIVPIQPLYIKSFLTIVCLVSSFFGIFRSIRLLMNRAEEDNKNE